MAHTSTRERRLAAVLAVALWAATAFVLVAERDSFLPTTRAADGAAADLHEQQQQQQQPEVVAWFDRDLPQRWRMSHDRRLQQRQTARRALLLRTPVSFDSAEGAATAMQKQQAADARERAVLAGDAAGAEAEPSM